MIRIFALLSLPQSAYAKTCILMIDKMIVYFTMHTLTKIVNGFRWNVCRVSSREVKMKKWTKDTPISVSPPRDLESSLEHSSLIFCLYLDYRMGNQSISGHVDVCCTRRLSSTRRKKENSYLLGIMAELTTGQALFGKRHNPIVLIFLSFVFPHHIISRWKWYRSTVSDPEVSWPVATQIHGSVEN